MSESERKDDAVARAEGISTSGPRALESEALSHLEAQLARVTEELAVASHIGDTFWAALKPLNLPAINVQNPGLHVTELIEQLARMTAERDASRRLSEAQHGSLLRLKERADAAEAALSKVTQERNALMMGEAIAIQEEQRRANQAEAALSQAKENASACNVVAHQLRQRADELEVAKDKAEEALSALREALLEIAQELREPPLELSEWADRLAALASPRQEKVDG